MSNGPRQDWLACPHRALDQGLLEDVVRRLFRVPAERSVLVTPAPTLAKDEGRIALTRFARAGNSAVVYLRNMLGGEISISASARSPEFSFDITLIEIVSSGDTFEIGRFGILEVQTMDFHGSYQRAVANLKDALRLHPENFHEVLGANGGRWVSERIEGPNIANVFKRTFHQMMLKFQIGAHPSSVGCALAIPLAVWDSWQRFLGRPDLLGRPDGTFAMRRPGSPPPADHVPAWIYIFDIAASNSISPNPIEVRQIIATDVDAIGFYALKVAPEAAMTEGVASGRLAVSIRQRLSAWWPVFKAPGGTRHRTGE